MKFINLLLIVFLITLSSCEKEELVFPKERKLELPVIIKKNGSDSLDVDSKPKQKKKRKKFFLKKT